MAEGGYHDLDDLCSTRGTVALGFSDQLHYGGGFIHILLVIAVIVLVLGLFQRR